MGNPNCCFMIIAVAFFSPANRRGELCSVMPKAALKTTCTYKGKYFIPRSRVCTNLSRTVSWKWQKKLSLMDIGQSVQISAGSWIVHMARTESQVERPKKNYRSRAFSNLGRLMQDPVIMRDRLVLTLSFFPTGGALPTTLVSVTSLEYLSLAEFTLYWRIIKTKGLWKLQSKSSRHLFHISNQSQ